MTIDNSKLETRKQPRSEESSRVEAEMVSGFINEPEPALETEIKQTPKVEVYISSQGVSTVHKKVNGITRKFLVGSLTGTQETPQGSKSYHKKFEIPCDEVTEIDADIAEIVAPYIKA